DRDRGARHPRGAPSLRRPGERLAPLPALALIPSAAAAAFLRRRKLLETIGGNPSAGMQTVVDSVWVLFSACLVFFMHAGFALVESGFCRRKNAVMVLLKNVGVVSLSSLLFFALGFGVMFGDGNAFFGTSGFFPAADAAFAGAPAHLPLYVFLFFQLVFAATAATIVSGAVA